MMLLVIDIGNTNMVLGLFDKEVLMRSWRLSTAENRTSDEMGILIYSLLSHIGVRPEGVENIIISTVVPNIMYSMTNGIRKYFDITPIIVNRDMKLGVTFNEVYRSELGSDRLVNCIAAYKLFGGPVIVIDYGTANTYDAVTKEGEIITAITAPGIKIRAEALASRGAQLSNVELVLPNSLIVRSTAQSMQAGILYGVAGETEYIVNRLKAEVTGPGTIVAATGGLAQTITKCCHVFDHIVPALTLEGLRFVYEMNRDWRSNE